MNPRGLVQPRNLLLLLAAGALTACAAQAPLPNPRPLVNFSGARVIAEPERMEEVDSFVRRALHDMERNPSYLIRLVPEDSVRLPWEGFAITGDTASIELQRGAVDARTPYQVYAFLHLMAHRGILSEWAPGLEEELEGYALERRILELVADVWLYGRSIYDAAPYQPLDEMLWANDAGFLDAYILTARGGEFPDERERWNQEQAAGLEEYREWFRATFSENPPGLRTAGNGPPP